ncbi:MAG TPA: response regulator [Stellaceae bacterium]
MIIVDGRRDAEHAAAEAGRWPLLPAALLAGCGTIAVVSALLLRLATADGSDLAAVANVALPALLLSPLAAAFITSLRGLPNLAAAFARSRRGEAVHAVLRVAAASVAFAYVAIAAGGAGAPPRSPLAGAVAVAGIAAVVAWLFLAHLMLRPEASAFRRNAALACEVGLLSIFMHLGGAVATPWYALYMLIACGYGVAASGWTPAVAAALAAAGFAAVVASTPFWLAQLPLSAGLAAALLLLPVVAIRMVRRVAAAEADVERAEASKVRLLAVLGHELRAPLNTVIGLGGLLGNSPLEPEQRDLLSATQLAARSLLDLAADIETLAEVESARLRADPEIFQLYELAHAAVAMLRPEATAKGLRLTLRIDPGMPPVLRGWPQQMRQILTNLLGNAIKLSDHGRVSIALDGVPLDGAAAAVGSGGRIGLRITVRHRAEGLTSGALAKLFDLFVQADISMTRRRGGTGLGLAIVKQLATLLGGEIAIECADSDKGAAYIVTIPVDVDPAANGREPDLRDRLVLIVSDDRTLPTVLEPRLRAWHAAARWIDRPEEALRRLDSGAEPMPAAIVLDGRRDALGALSFAHQLTQMIAAPPPVLFVADPAWREPVLGLADNLVAAVVAWPFDDAILANAFRIFPTMPQSGEGGSGAGWTGAAAGGGLRTLRVLLAESNGQHRRIVQRILDAAGHEVDMVESGEEVLRVLDAASADLVLIDVGLPGLNALDVTRLYRLSHGEGPRLPIVGLAATANAETERLCREAGMDALLAKPVEPGELLAMLDLTLKSVGGGAGASASQSPAAPAVVTPISSHPKFAPDAAGGTPAPAASPGGAAAAPGVIDDAAIEALRALGAGSDFFTDVIETFRKDARHILDLTKRAAAAGDVRAFREHTHSLRSSAANVGGARFCQALTTMNNLTARDLRGQADELIDRLYGEFARLESALDQKLRETGSD